MGGADKGLADHGGRPLVASAIERLAPQVGNILINANRNLDAYRVWGHDLVSDFQPDSFAGPLAGLQAGLAACTTPWLVSVPCDAPRFPLDLVDRLQAGLAGGDACYVVTASGTQAVFLLCRHSLSASLDSFLTAGHRKVHDWLTTIDARSVYFDDESAFANLNTPEDLTRGQ